MQVREGEAEGVGKRIHGDSLLLGRGPASDIVPDGQRIRAVSARHAEVRRGEEGIYRLVDLDSTNGTFLNGKRIDAARLSDGDIIMLGPDGPRFRFRRGEVPEEATDRTLASVELDEASSAGETGAKRRRRGSYEDLAEEAVSKARQARSRQQEGQTLFFMREALQQAVSHSRRRWKILVAGLGVALLAVSAYAWWAVLDLREQKGDIDYHINRIEGELAETRDPEELRRLSAELEEYQRRAEKLQESLLFQLGGKDEETDFIEDQLHLLLEEFGAEEYSIPPAFAQRVRHFIQYYRERDPASMERALITRRTQFERVRRTLREHNLPPDLAYMTVVESSFKNGRISSRGAAGVWQMMPATARSYGLEVSGEADERLDIAKQTRAAARHIRHLILEFGAGSSVMLALAAYNSGQARVKRAIRRKVEEPLRQRNFWFLYRVRALPPETRNYVPKVLAAILIGRNPGRFGFQPPATD